MSTNKLARNILWVKSVSYTPVLFEESLENPCHDSPSGCSRDSLTRSKNQTIRSTADSCTFLQNLTSKLTLKMEEFVVISELDDPVVIKRSLSLKN